MCVLSLVGIGARMYVFSHLFILLEKYSWFVTEQRGHDAHTEG